MVVESNDELAREMLEAVRQNLIYSIDNTSQIVCIYDSTGLGR